MAAIARTPRSLAISAQLGAMPPLGRCKRGPCPAAARKARSCSLRTAAPMPARARRRYRRRRCARKEACRSMHAHSRAVPTGGRNRRVGTPAARASEPPGAPYRIAAAALTRKVGEAPNSRRLFESLEDISLYLPHMATHQISGAADVPSADRLRDSHVRFGAREGRGSVWHIAATKDRHERERVLDQLD